MSRTHWLSGSALAAVLMIAAGSAPAAHAGKESSHSNKGHSAKQADHGAKQSGGSGGHSSGGNRNSSGHNSNGNQHMVAHGGGGASGGHSFSGGHAMSGGGSGHAFSGGGSHSFSGPSISRSLGSSSFGSSMSRSFGGSSLGNSSRNFGSQSFSRGTSNGIGSNSFSRSQNLGTSHWSNSISNWQSNHINSTWQSARNTSTWQQHANDWHNGQNWANNNWSHNGNWNNNNWSHNGNWNNGNWNNWSHNNWWWGHNRFWWYPVISIGASLWPWWGYDNYYPAYYSTPYYGAVDYAPLTAVVTQPDVVQSQYAQAPPQQQTPTAADNGEAGAEFFADAVTAFRNGQYKDALRLANHAAVESPQNPKAHELMSMALFASNDYRGASAEAHAALAFGPPASWETVYGYYGNDATYTDQLRALEKYSRDNPTAADARFLRAYEYLMLGHEPQALDQLREVTKLAPQDQLAAELVKKYSGETSAKPLLPPDPAPLPPPSGNRPVDKGGVDS